MYRAATQYEATWGQVSKVNWQKAASPFYNGLADALLKKVFSRGRILTPSNTRFFGSLRRNIEWQQQADSRCTMMHTVDRLHPGDQRQDHHCVENARSNRNVFSWRLNALWSVKSWSSVGSSFQALGPACEKHLSPNLSRVVSGSYRLVSADLSRFRNA